MGRKLLPMNAYIGNLEILGMTSKYMYEPKLDGVRALCHVNHGLSFESRSGKSHAYPELKFRKNIKARSAILDGEIVAFDKRGLPNFQTLQEGGTPFYVVFDILELNGDSLRHMPLSERKKLLQKTVRDGEHIEKIFYTSHGKELWKTMTRKHLEGVMAKEIDSLYYPNRRSRVWLKIKQHQTGDCIIIGYTQERRSLSALLLAVYDGKKLVYIGRVGTGFNSENTPEILRKLKKLQRAKPPKGIENEDGVTWVSPQQVCEVKYAEVTRGGMLRAPVFTHLRTDKPAKDCDTKQFVRFG